jgi:amidohydrolase
MSDLLSEARELFEYTRGLRRDFHMHPELGFQEVRTAGIVARELGGLGLEVSTGVGGTGVTALIEGSQPGRTLLLRADMDALPIHEETGAEYASQTDGVMHACGHDAHTAVLLTVARLLLAHRDEFAGAVKLAFQPAEEGLGGAEKMIADGVLEGPRVDACLALHVWNEKPLGWIGVSDGPSMAGGEIFKLRVLGRGGHGAVPQLAVDPILAAAQIVTALQGIVARNVGPLETAVVSVCTIHAGETFNVIPPAVEMTGTIRTFDPAVRRKVLERFEQTVKSVAEGLGCRVELELEQLTPAVVNHTPTARLVQETARRLLPEATLETGNYITMGSEDMAYIMEKVPGCFFFVGSANPEKGFSAAHHHPKFDIDESCLPQAAALMAASAVRWLAEKP